MIYYFLYSKDKTFITRYFMYHCSILEADTNTVYHFTGRNGYCSESLTDFLQENTIVKRHKFTSNKDIKAYFNQCKEKNKAYNPLTNNCETFANDFLGYRLSRQTEFYLFTTFLLLTIRWSV